MGDKYSSFAELAASEPNTAYTITLRDLGTSIAVIAPHGGCIEPGTSEIAAAIAGDEYSLYLFEGMKARSNGDLHITSAHFDEPSCVSLLRSTPIALTVHGEKSSFETVYIGGGHSEIIIAMRAALEHAGFRVREHSNVSLRGLDKRNICNKGTCEAGLQLELSHGLRKSCFNSLTRSGRERPTARLSQLRTAVRRALSQFGVGKSRL